MAVSRAARQVNFNSVEEPNLILSRLGWSQVRRICIVVIAESWAGWPTVARVVDVLC